MISFAGQLDEKLFRRAIAAPLRGARLFGAVLAALALIGLVSSIGSSHPRQALPQAAPMFLVGVFGLALWASPWLTARRQLKTSKLLQSRIEGTASEESLRLSSPFSTSEVPWSAFHRALVRPDTVLLYQSAAVFHAIPREFFADEASWNQFVALVRARVPKPPSAFLRNLAIWLVIFIVILFLFR